MDFLGLHQESSLFASLFSPTLLLALLIIPLVLLLLEPFRLILFRICAPRRQLCEFGLTPLSDGNIRFIGVIFVVELVNRRRRALDARTLISRFRRADGEGEESVADDSSRRW